MTDNSSNNSPRKNWPHKEQVNITVRQLQNINDRDKAILKFVFENSMATSAQIRSGFFANSEWSYHRMRHLVRIGLLRIIMRDPNNNRVFGITPLGMSYVKIAASPFDDLTGLTPRYYSSVDHDLVVNEVRTILETSSVVTKFVPENVLAVELRKKYGKRARADKEFKLPDAAVSFASGSKRHFAAIEVELSKKSKERLMRIFELLILGTDFTITLFIVKDKALLNYLQTNYDSTWNLPSVQFNKQLHACYFVTLEDFRNRGLHATFVGRERSWSFKELENGTVVPPSVGVENVVQSLEARKSGTH